MNNRSKYPKTAVPNIESFYSKLSTESATENDDKHVKNAWNIFHVKNLGDYNYLQVQSDNLLFTDFFEIFRKKCNLDSVYFYLTAWLAWNAALKTKKVNLELVIYICDLLMIEKEK